MILKKCVKMIKMKNEITLVDTSSWIESLRRHGSINVRERVRKLLINGTASWCDMVSVELWNGARGEKEKKRLAELEKAIICLPTTEEVWVLARKLAKKCRNAGQTIPSTDLLITSCALFYEAEIEHCDTHIGTILKIYQDNLEKP